MPTSSRSAALVVACRHLGVGGALHARRSGFAPMFELTAKLEAEAVSTAPPANLALTAAKKFRGAADAASAASNTTSAAGHRRTGAESAARALRKSTVRASSAAKILSAAVCGATSARASTRSDGTSL